MAPAWPGAAPEAELIEIVAMLTAAAHPAEDGVMRALPKLANRSPEFRNALFGVSEIKGEA
jgi:hypothetical protein